MIPAVQTKLKYAIINNIQHRLGSDVSIGYFRLGFPKSLDVNEVLISKNESDTLLYLNKFSVNIRIFPLLRKQIVIQNIDLTNGRGDIGKLIGQIPSDTTKSHLNKKEERTSKSWDLQINKLVIESCHFKYKDETNSGYDMALDIGKARIQIGSLDSATLISFNSVDIENTYFYYKSLFTSHVKNDSESSAFADIRIKETFLKNVEFDLIDSSDAVIFNASGKDLELSKLLVDLNNKSVIFDEGIVEQTSCFVSSTSSNNTLSSSYEYLNWGKKLWRVEGKDLAIKDYKIIVENKEVLDFSKNLKNESLNLFDINGRLANFILDEDFLIVEIEKLSGKDINGFEIIELNALIDQKDTSFSVQNLNLQTPISEYKINLTTNISPTNYMDLDGKSFSLGLDIKSNNLYEVESFFSLMDKYDFLSNEFMNESFDLHTQISGDFDNLKIEQLNFLYSDSTQIIAKGNITKLSEPDSLQLEIQIDKLMVPKNILEIGEEYLIKDLTFSVPDYLLVDGIYKSSNDEHYFSGNVESNVGEIEVRKGVVNLRNIPEYNLTASAYLRNLNTITDIDLDNISFSMNALYKGEEINTADGFIEFDLDSLTYNKYKYGKLKMVGEMTNGQFETKINSCDTNFLFSLGATGEYIEKKLKASIDTDVGKIDFTFLDIYDEELTIGGKAAFEISFIDQNNFAVNSIIHNLDLCFSDTLIKLLSAEISFETNDLNTDIKLKSEYANFELVADDYILNVVNSFADLPVYYLEVTKDDSVKFNMPDFNIKGQIDFPESYASHIPLELPEFTKLSVIGTYDKNNDTLNFDFSVLGIRHKEVIIDSLGLSVSGSSTDLDFRSKMDFYLKEMVEGYLSIDGKFRNSELVTNLRYFDTFSNQYLNITAQIQKEEDKILVHLDPEMFILSYDQWEINPDNQFIFSPTSFELNNVDLRSNGQQISLSSFPIEYTQNIEANLKNFNLNSMKQLYKLDTLVAGNLNANFKVLNVFNNPSIEGNLEVDSLSIQDFDAGKLTLSKFIFKDNLAQAEMSLRGKTGDIQVSGSYDKNKSNAMDLNLDINYLDLSELNFMLSDYIKDASGNLNGRIIVDGNLERPVFNGSLSFKDVGTEILFLKKYFRLGNEIITIENNLVDFDSLSIVNKHNQSARIIGQISFDFDKMPYSNLQVITDNMKILNTTRRENNVVFGLLKAQSDIKIAGYADRLKVDANVEIDESSDITYVIPDILVVNDSRGVVRYVIFDGDSINEKNTPKASTFLSLESFDDLRSQVKIIRGSRVNIFFDRGGNNFLEASIHGTVNHRMYKGVTEVSGRLEVDEGQLRYSIPMVTAKNYEIEQGSYITLLNDLYDPYININASSDVRASTEGLLDGHNKVLNFKVLLYMNGRLSNLKLRFDISPKVNDAMVSTRLALLTEEERNINAINLLAQGTFVISVEGSGEGLESMADNQVDKFLTNQLNSAISENIQFVDLHFDVQSFNDYSSSDRTVFQRNYYYNVGKSFLRDRARVNYTGSMEFTSNMFSEQLHSSFVQNEFDVEVKIDKEGTFRGVFFRKNKYEGILEGEVVETGGGIRIIKNFDSVKDIFTRDKKSEKDTINKEPEKENE